MEIKRAIDLGDNVSEKLSELYVDVFFDDGLKYFSKDRAKLKKAFSYVFLPENIYVAMIDNEIVGMIACIGRGPFCMNFWRRGFFKHMGIIKGLFTYFAFKKYSKISQNLDEDTALVEFVSTSPQHQRKGIASNLMKYLFTLPQYKIFVLEVADTNPKVFELYKKLGYKELYRKKIIPKSGINYWIQMKYI